VKCHVRLMDAIIPGFNKPLWFDTVTSTFENAVSARPAFGEILVNPPLIPFGRHPAANRELLPQMPGASVRNPAPQS